MRIFFAGIVQGSCKDGEIFSQDYRVEIADILKARFPDVELVDPLELNPGRAEYNTERAIKALHELGELAGQADALVAYLPSASMGAAIEIWNAHLAGVPIFTISPLDDNWVVACFAERVFPDIAAFGEFVAEGGLDNIKA